MTVRRLLPTSLLAVGLALAACPAPARAHFLFAHVGPLAEGGRQVEVFFSAQADAGDPKYVERFHGTTLWVQAEPGQFRPLEVRPGVDRLRATVPPSGSLAVIGQAEYGVIARPKQTPFLLRYYPKAVAGDPDELNALKPKPEIPLEIAATFAEGSVTLVALRDGKPTPGATFTAVDVDLEEDAVTAGPDGKAAWTPKHPGRWCVYTRHDTKVNGEAGGMSYEEIRAFATLTFDWPLDRDDADDEAVALFEEALDARAGWEDFPGFTADRAGPVDDHAFTGTVTIAADGTARVALDDQTVLGWVQDQLNSLTMHRMGRPAGLEKPVLRFADDRDDHPLGRLLTFEGGRFGSSYRIKDRQIRSVNRNLVRQVITITTIDNDKNPEGKFLPRSYVVQYWDAASGQLNRTETIQDRWIRLGGFDLPTEHSVVTASPGTLSVRTLTLSGHKLARE